MNRSVWFFAAAVVAAPLAPAQEPRLENFPYPFPVEEFAFRSQEQDLAMAFMDVKPAPEKANGETILLLHGKNFSGAYWRATAEVLRDAGYRVVIPDQLGFGKSSKPAHYQFSFHQLATNTRALLQHLGLVRAHVLGHSMGGMLATRYALLFPEDTQSLVLLDPIGLEDWLAKGVPYLGVDAWYRRELQQTPEKARAYQRESYYHGTWRPEYEEGVKLTAAFLASPDYPRMAWVQALTYDMILTQPVCHEFDRLHAPVLLIVGSLDRTAIGRDQVPEPVRKTLGDYPALARAAADKIPRCRLVVLDGLGHLPQVEDLPRVTGPLLPFLKANRRR